MTIIIDDDGIGHKVITLAELDKMRSEIDKMDYLSIEDGSDGYDHYIDKHDVFQIIDKYRVVESVDDPVVKPVGD